MEEKTGVTSQIARCGIAEKVMMFVLSIVRKDEAPLEIALDAGAVLFVLGANGTGKSSLMHRFYGQHGQAAKRISAHRQTWFQSNDLALSGMERRNLELNVRSQDTNENARYREEYAPQRSSIALYDLVDAENVRARRIAGAVDADDLDLAKLLSRQEAPIKTINALLRLSNIPVVIWVEENEQVRARKNGSAPYGVSELSDGERNALIIAATILTANPGSIFLIDEPERHLHRSIISPLLTALFAERSDCAFVVSTHDLMLPLDNPSAQSLLVRACEYSGSSVTYWQADLLASDASVEDKIKEDIIGARRRILFVEGVASSMDRPLYGLLFPEVSVVPKESCREVEQAVRGIRAAQELHWLEAWGLIDGDGRGAEDRNKLKEQGIFALAVYSVEAIYYHPEVMKLVAVRSAALTGDDGQQRYVDAVHAGLAAIGEPQVAHLSSRAAEKTVRERIFAALPTRQSVAACKNVSIDVDVASELLQELQRLQDAISKRDLLMILTQYPVRETPMLGTLASKLGFRSRSDYEKAVRKLFIDEPDTLVMVRNLFEELPDKLQGRSLIHAFSGEAA
jgi:ABC-type cobalamin/Fe3+-siderophores transport system ATPase subunit